MISAVSSRIETQRDDADRESRRIERRRFRRSPDAGWFPEPGGAINRREHGASRADALSGHDVNLDAGFMERPQHTRVVRAVRARAAKHEGGAARGRYCIRWRAKPRCREW